MSATTLYRIAAVLLMLFAAGHTFGFLRFKPPTAESRAVRDAMNTVRFPIGSSSFTYGGFYVGFGLFVSAYLLFAAFLAWVLGGLVKAAPHAIQALAWGFFAVQVATLVLSWSYFAAPPALFAALIAVCVGYAAWLIPG
jgi:hypothetical protein